MAFLSKGAGHQFNKMDRHHRNMAATENRNSSLTTILEHRQFLGKRIDSIERW